MTLCLTAGAISVTLAVQAFTLAWTHSVEKIRWEEDWIIEGGRLLISEARVRGSGAGMEPPPEAIFHHGAWHYRPKLPPLRDVNLANSPFTSGYELCHADHCRPLSSYLPTTIEAGTITLKACER